VYMCLIRRKITPPRLVR